MQIIYYEQVLVPSLHSEEVLGSFFFWWCTFGWWGSPPKQETKSFDYEEICQDSIYAFDGVQMDGRVVHQFQ